MDLILHPLKSELNFPIGRKEALDLTQNRMGKGLRWELPHALLDGIFYALDLTEGNPPKLTSALLASREAENVLLQIKEVITEGVSTFFFFSGLVCGLLVWFEDIQISVRALQHTPHLILLSRVFYMNKMLPLLAKWMVLWISLLKKAVKGVTDDLILKYLVTPRKLNQVFRYNSRSLWQH